MVSMPVCAQLLPTPERQAWNNIEKKRWDRVESQLQKALRKDSLNATARFVYAAYFLSPENPAFNIDSSYHYILASQADFQQSDIRERERMKRFPLDSLVLLRLRERIDSAAFELATRTNTVEAYDHFLLVYSTASQHNRAVELRDEVAYFNAMKENSYQAFAEYLEKYPASARAKDAKDKYNTLLYENKTNDKRLKSYHAFVKEFPDSPYRHAAELQIFEKMTAVGSIESFEEFLSQYPQSSYTRKAKNILYHILKEENAEHRSSSVWNDSLRAVNESEKKILVPFFKDGKYGFIDQEGREVIAPNLEEPGQAYQCGNITDDILIFKNKAISKHGPVIYQGELDSMEDLGYGFILIETSSCSIVIHKSGFKVADCVDDARILDGRIFAIKRNERWSLHALNGKKLPSGEWSDIHSIGAVFVFQRDKKSILAKLSDIEVLADSGKLEFSDDYDEIKPWQKGLIWFRKGDLQGLMDQSLNTVIQPVNYVLTSFDHACLAKSPTGYFFYNSKGQQSVQFENVTSHGSWTAVKNQGWRLYHVEQSRYLSSSFDSIAFKGPFVFGISKDPVRVFFSESQVADLPDGSVTEFLPGKDSTSYLMVETGDTKTIYNRLGARMFSLTVDKIQYAGSGFFIIQKKDRTRKDRRGLVDETGRVILQPEFDAIGSVTDDVVSLLKDKKFGLFNCRTLKQIKPVYTKNVTRYALGHLTAFQNGFYGFITWDEKVPATFEFEEIRYWNDSVAWVRKNYQWMLYNIEHKTAVDDQISNYTIVADTGQEQIAIIKQEGHYGVISSKRDEIIPPTLSRIINVGSAEQPVYFTAKHVEEASIYVVIYYNKDGRLLRRQVYEEDEYEKISCISK
jgi:TolA-binding protein